MENLNNTLASSNHRMVEYYNRILEELGEYLKKAVLFSQQDLDVKLHYCFISLLSIGQLGGVQKKSCVEESYFFPVICCLESLQARRGA